MIDQNVLDYIKETREKGFTDKLIKKAMLKQGYDETTINEAFELSSPHTATNEHSRFFNKKILSVAIVLLVVCFSVALFLIPQFARTVGFASQIQPLGDEVYGAVDKACNLDIRINILDVYGQKKICYQQTRLGSALQFLIENLGPTDVDGLKVVIISNEGVYEQEVPESALPMDEVKSIFVEYEEQELGKIEKVKIYPIINNPLGMSKACTDSMISVSDVKKC